MDNSPEIPGICFNPLTSLAQSLSSGAVGLLIPLGFSLRTGNRVRKDSFRLKMINRFKDPRTFNKYWAELKANNVVSKVEGQVWMVNPNEVYRTLEDYSELLDVWSTLTNGRI